MRSLRLRLNSAQLKLGLSLAISFQNTTRGNVNNIPSYICGSTKVFYKKYWHNVIMMGLPRQTLSQDNLMIKIMKRQIFHRMLLIIFHVSNFEYIL